MTVEQRREWFKLYMRQYRLGRHRVRRPIRAPFGDRPGHCENCGHVWPAGGRCPLCALESPSARRAGPHFVSRRWSAWARLMEIAP